MVSLCSTTFFSPTDIDKAEIVHLSPFVYPLSPFMFLQEWTTPQPSRRPDIMPEFEKLETPPPRKMPGDPEQPDEEEEEEKEKEKPEEEPEEQPDQPPSEE